MLVRAGFECTRACRHPWPQQIRKVAGEIPALSRRYVLPNQKNREGQVSIIPSLTRFRACRR